MLFLQGIQTFLSQIPHLVHLGLDLKTRIRFGKLEIVLKPVDRPKILGGVENT